MHTASQFEAAAPGREVASTAPKHARRHGELTLRLALMLHWPEYLMEFGELAVFMVSACIFTVLVEHTSSPVHHAIASPMLRRSLIGLAMGLTAILLIYSPWGKQSGAHFNPSTTLTFLRLGKIHRWDAAFYMLAQFAGGVLGVLLSALILGQPLAHRSVRYATTVPGDSGTLVAFAAEVVISFFLMTLVLNVSNRPAIARLTGLFAGILVATYISLESPISGMSMNPARTLASAVPARLWSALWIYFTAPPMGMLLAAELFVRSRGKHAVLCAKLHHASDKRCIFRCNFPPFSNQQLDLKEMM